VFHNVLSFLFELGVQALVQPHERDEQGHDFIATQPIELLKGDCFVLGADGLADV
jgi:hypothetical protein